MLSSLSQYFPVIIGVITFIVLGLFFLGIIIYLRDQLIKREWAKKLRQDGEHESTLKHPVTTGNTSPAPLSASGIIHMVSKPFTPKEPEEYSRMNMKFIQAGLRSSNIRYTFWGFKFIFMVILPLIFLILWVNLFLTFNILFAYIILVYLLLFGFYLPNLWLSFLISRRKRKIFEALPDALDLMIVCVEAGIGLDSAIARVGDEIQLTSKDLSDELRIVNLETRAGKPRIEALRNLARRTDLEDVNSLCTLLIQTDRFGTSLAPALRVYADTFRTKRFQAAEVRAAKLPVNLLFPLIFLIFPALFVVILGPSIVRFLQFLNQW